MFERRLSAGIEFGALSARIAVVSPGAVPTVLACEEIAVNAGEETRLGTLAAKSLERLGAAKADVHLAFLPTDAAALRHHLFTGPKLRRNELNLVAVRELRKDGVVDPSQVFFSVDSLGAASGADAALQRYLCVALQRDVLDQVATALLDSKKVIRSATSAAMALLRAANVAELPQAGVVAIAQIDPRRSWLLVLEDGAPQFFRDIPTPFARGGQGNDPLLAQALARELEISLVYFAQQNRPKQVATLMVVGDGEISERVSEMLDDAAAYDLVRFAAGPKLAAGKDAPANLAPYAAAIGAALGPRVRALPNVLPPELQSRPERLIAFAAAGVLVVALMAGILQLRGGEVERADAAATRLREAEIAFSELERRVQQAASLDEASVRAERWMDVFDAYGDYQKNYAKFLHGLPAALPAYARFSELMLEQVLEGPRAAPRPGGPDQLQKFRLQGVVRAGDMQAAQSDLRQLVRAVETIPTVKTAELLPIRAPDAVDGIIELPFTLDVGTQNDFPGPRK